MSANLDAAVDDAVAALRHVGRIAEMCGVSSVQTTVDQMVSDLLDVWERAE